MHSDRRIDEWETPHNVATNVYWYIGVCRGFSRNLQREKSSPCCSFAQVAESDVLNYSISKAIIRFLPESFAVMVMPVCYRTLNQPLCAFWSWQQVTNY